MGTWVPTSKSRRMTYDLDTDLDTTTHKIIGVVGSPLYLAPYNRYKNVSRFPLRQAETPPICFSMKEWEK